MCQQIDMKPDVQIPVPAARLFKWNVAMSVFHTTFAIVVLAAGQIDLKLPVYGSKMQLVVLANETDDDNGWKYVPLQPDRVGWLHATVFTAIFFFCSAFAHFRGTRRLKTRSRRCSRERRRQPRSFEPRSQRRASMTNAPATTTPQSSTIARC